MQTSGTGGRIENFGIAESAWRVGNNRWGMRLSREREIQGFVFDLRYFVRELLLQPPLGLKLH